MSNTDIPSSINKISLFGNSVISDIIIFNTKSIINVSIPPTVSISLSLVNIDILTFVFVILISTFFSINPSNFLFIFLFISSIDSANKYVLIPSDSVISCNILYICIFELYSVNSSCNWSILLMSLLIQINSSSYFLIFCNFSVISSSIIVICLSISLIWFDINKLFNICCLFIVYSNNCLLNMSICLFSSKIDLLNNWIWLFKCNFWLLYLHSNSISFCNFWLFISIWFISLFSNSSISIYILPVSFFICVIFDNIKSLLNLICMFCFMVLISSSKSFCCLLSVFNSKFKSVDLWLSSYILFNDCSNSIFLVSNSSYINWLSLFDLIFCIFILMVSIISFKYLICSHFASLFDSNNCKLLYCVIIISSDLFNNIFTELSILSIKVLILFKSLSVNFFPVVDGLKYFFKSCILISYIRVFDTI